MIDHLTRLNQEHSAIENNLKYQLDQLANSPNFKSNFKLYSKIKKKLINLQIKKHKKKLIKNDELFQYSHNLATKEFFRQFIQKREKVMIQELVDEYGLPRTSPGELIEHVQRYYTGLYTYDQNDATKQTVFLDNINAKLSDQQNNNLQLDLSEREIETAICQMAKGKAPGPDGLSIEFYIHCWPIVKDEVVSMLREMFSTQTIHPQIKTGYLTLIYKKRQKNKITNYRPISLLNYDLKILTKCLTNRIKTIIPDLTSYHNTSMQNRENKSLQRRLCFGISGGMCATVKLMHTSFPWISGRPLIQ